MSFRLARVIAVHPGRRRLDLVMSDNGQRVADVHVMGNVSSDSGSWNVPDVPLPASDAGPDALSPSGRNLVAICAMIHGRPVVMGFLAPLGSEMNFSEANREVHRHPSGAYTTIAPDGSIETFHPSGAFLRIGTGDHQDLAPLTSSGNWTIPTGAPLAQVTLATAGFTLTILPNGSTTLTTTGQLLLNYESATLTGNTTINGKLDVTGEVTAKAGTGSSVTLSGHRGHVPGGPPPTPGT